MSYQYVWMSVSACFSEQGLLMHQKIHTGRYRFNFTCSLCSKGFPFVSTLREHELKEHRMVNDAYCPVCRKQFLTVSALREHILTRHADEVDEWPKDVAVDVTVDDDSSAAGGVRGGTGDKVSRKFVRGWVRKMYKTRLTCQICKTRFETKLSLTNHLQKVHQVYSLFCSYCGKGMCLLVLLCFRIDNYDVKSYM